MNKVYTTYLWSQYGLNTTDYDAMLDYSQHPHTLVSKYLDGNYEERVRWFNARIEKNLHNYYDVLEKAEKEIQRRRVGTKIQECIKDLLVLQEKTMDILTEEENRDG